MTNTAIILSLLGAAAGPFLAYITIRYKSGGSIKTSEAVTLWAEAAEFRRVQEDRISRMEARIARLEATLAEKEDEVSTLRQEVWKAEQENLILIAQLRHWTETPPHRDGGGQ